jgi:hypothetical protein
MPLTDHRAATTAAAAVTAAGVLAAAVTLPPPASAATRRQPSIIVDTAAVHVQRSRPGYVELSVRFPERVLDVRGWITAGDDGPGNTRVNRIDRAEATPGYDFTVWVAVTYHYAAADAGTWSVTSVQAVTAAGGAPVTVDWPNPTFEVIPVS